MTKLRATMLVLVTSICLNGVASATRADDGGDRLAREIDGLLLPHPDPGDAELERLAADLADMGGDAAAALLTAIERGGPLTGAGDASEVAVPWTRSQERAMFAALGHFEHDALRTALEGRVAPEADVAVRLTAVRVLDVYGAAEDLGFLVVSATPSKALPETHSEVAVPLRSAFRAILRRGAPSVPRLKRLVEGAHPEVRATLVNALDGLPREVELKLLAESLGLDVGLDALLLERIRSACSTAPTPARPELADQVRTYLAGANSMLARQAARVVGLLEDVDSMGALVELLRGDEPEIVEAATDALRAISRQAFGPDPTRWATWLEAEQRWFERTAPRSLKLLEHGDPSEAFTALRDITRHPLHRDALAQSLSLSHPDVRVRRMVCTALEQLRSRATEEALLECMAKDPDDTVARAAWQALRAVTGKDLPLDTAAWRAALAGRLE